LIEKKRCHMCATRLKERTPHQTCGTCGTAVFGEQGAGPYVDYVSGRLPVALGISAALSLVPLIGLLVGTVYYQFQLVYPFTGYLPFGRRFLLKWGIRLLFVVLFFFQLFPGIGAIVVPAMALVSFLAYRSAFKKIAASPVPQTTGSLPEAPHLHAGLQP
jgi:hypothetical protein